MSDAQVGPLKKTPTGRIPSPLPIALAFLIVLLIYAWIGGSDHWQLGVSQPEKSYYNLLVQGFQTGQLNLKTTVPPELGRLADPYDPEQNGPYRLHDVSFYQGKLYLYYSAIPALVLFGPYTTLTGHYLWHRQAAIIFCSAGFLIGAALLLAMARRYFPRTSPFVLLVGVLAIGLTNMVPVLLGRADIWEVPISCAYACTTLSLWALWRALHHAPRRVWWLSLASLAFGLAVASRPSLLLSSVILLVPIAAEWKKRKSPTGVKRFEILRLFSAAVIPIACIGIGLLLYNSLRFNSPWEFGVRYQMAGAKAATQSMFSLNYFWFDLRIYFLLPLQWTMDFPFVHGISEPPIPPGHGGVNGAFGALPNLPFLWFAGATALFWWKRNTEASNHLLWRFLLVVATLFGISALILCLFGGGADRYQVEFIPELSLLAVVGLFILEEQVRSHGQYRLLCFSAASLLFISATINWLASFKSNPTSLTADGNRLANSGAQVAAIEKFQKALYLEPDLAPAHHALASLLAERGQLPEAIKHFQHALRSQPVFAEAHHGLATVLFATGRVPEAIEQFRLAVRDKPTFAEAHNGLGVALLRQRDAAGAQREFEIALKHSPRFAEAHFNCAIALLQLGRAREAIPHLEDVLQSNPTFPGARDRLVSARQQAGIGP